MLCSTEEIKKRNIGQINITATNYVNAVLYGRNLKKKYWTNKYMLKQIIQFLTGRYIRLNYAGMN